MRSSPFAIVTLVAGLAGGAAIGFVLGRSGPAHAGSPDSTPQWVTPGPVEDSSPNEPRAQEKLSTVSALGPAASAATESSPSGLSEQDRAIAHRAAASGLSRVAADTAADHPDWTGVIDGLVLDEHGQPLAGVTVVTNGPQSWYGNSISARSTKTLGRAYIGSKALKEELETYAETRVQKRKKLRTATTDEAGAFKLTDLPPGVHGVQGYAEGYTFEQKQAEPGESTRLTGLPIGAFELDVRLPDGTVPEKAVILVYEDDDDPDVAGLWTPEEPEVRFKSKIVRIAAVHGEATKLSWNSYLGDYESSPKTLDLEKDGPGPHILELKVKDHLRVTVVDQSTSFPKVDPWVKAKQLDKEGASAVSLVRRRRGPFLLASVEPGSYEITAGRGNAAAEITETVTIGTGRNEHELTLGDLDPGRFAIIQCHGPDGAPLSGINFDFVGKKENGSRSGSPNALDRTGGEYWIDLQSIMNGDEDLLGLVLTAKSPVYGHLTQEIDLAAKTSTFQFESPATVTVAVSGSPTGTMAVTLIRVAEDDTHLQNLWNNRGHNGDVDKEGTADLGMVQPGQYDLLLRSKVNRWNYGPTLAKDRVTVRSGDQTLNIVAPALSEVVIHAPDFDKGTHVQLQLQRPDAGHHSSIGSAQIGEDHRARISNIAPGDYIAHIWSDQGQAQMSFTAPCGELLFERDIINAFEVISVVDDKVAARAGLVKGDMLLAVNGQPVKGQAFMNRLTLAITDGAAKVLVLRNGRELTVELEKASDGLNSWNALGAHLQAREIKGR